MGDYKSSFHFNSQAKNDASFAGHLIIFLNTMSLIDSIIIWPKLVEPHVSFFCKHVRFPKLSRTFQIHEVS